MPREKIDDFGSVEASTHVNSLSFGEENPQIVQALREYGEAQQRNETPNRQQLLARYPDVAEELAACLDALKFVNAAANGLQSPATENTSRKLGDAQDMLQPGILGDYQIICEIGRGGMGVVYEATQISLGRRVALKVLPFAAMLDPRQLTRFKNEAQAAATLDHPNIVSVYAIGCDRSVHYFAMQYVAGQTLAEVIRDLRQRDGLADVGDRDSATISYVLTGESEPKTPVAEPHPAPASAPTVRAPQAAISTQRATNNKAYFQNIARLGIQAAEALDHAHEHGILHRDVKPGNLMLEATGKLWVTDFGLARIMGDAGMTMTGDLVGTLRYMSPEQALAKRVVVDHRSDIYSLGVTLYELLTLRPAFASDDRQELLRAIAFDEPAPLRTFNRAIPAELETIVLKAIAKDSRERYTTAQEMADDLNRFLADQPIRARRPSFVNIARKWSRRHRAVVTAASLVALVALVVGAGLLWRERLQTLAALERADANFRHAQNAVNRYLTAVSESNLGQIPGMEPVREKLLEAAVEYYQSFATAHADDPALETELAAAHCRLAQIYRLRGSGSYIDELTIAVTQLESLERKGVKVGELESFRDGVLLWRYRRGGVPVSHAQDLKLARLCEQAIPLWERLIADSPQSRGLISDLATWHVVRGSIAGMDTEEGARSIETATALWRRLTAVTPNDDHFRSSIARAFYELGLRRHQRPEAISYYQCAAAAIDPLFAAHGEVSEYADLVIVIYGHLGEVLDFRGRTLEARAEWSKAIELAPLTSGGFESRAKAYQGIGDHQRALADSRRAVQLAPTNIDYRNTLSRILGSQGRAPTVAECSRAIELDPDNAEWYFERAQANHVQRQYQDALADCNRAIELSPNVWLAYYARCILLIRMHRYDEALGEVNDAIHRHPEQWRFWQTRGALYARLEKCHEALADMNAAVELAKDEGEDSEALLERGRLHREMENLDEAEADFKLVSKRKYVRGVDWAARAKAELGLYDDVIAGSPAGHELRVKLLLHLRQSECALQEATKMAGAKLADGHSWQGVALAELERYDEAASNFSRAIELTPYRVEDWCRRGWIASVQGRYDDARNDFEEAVKIDEYDPLALRRLAWFLATCDDEKYRDAARAVALAERAAAIKPHDGVFWYTLGICHCRAAQYDAALKACQRALDLRDKPYSPLEDPRFATDYDHDAGFFLAMSQWQLGEKDKARETYNSAVAWMQEHAPNDAPLARFRAEAAELFGADVGTENVEAVTANPVPAN